MISYFNYVTSIQLGIFPVLAIRFITQTRPGLTPLTLSPPRRLYLRQFQRVLRAAARMLVSRPYLDNSVVF